MKNIILQYFIKNNITYYIISHNIKLINQYKKQISRFKNKPNINYILVGSVKRKSADDIIVLNNYEDNIEKYPKLCSYTAWYAIPQNKLCSTSKICLLEYDTLLYNNFFNLNDSVSNNFNGIISYSYEKFDDPIFYSETPYLESSLKKFYNIDLKNFINKYKNEYYIWPTSTNVTMPISILNDFIKWFHPMTKMFRQRSLGSYVHERAFFVFCILNNIPIKYLSNHILHSELRSHKNN